MKATHLDLGNVRLVVDTMTCTGKLPYGCPNCKGLDFCLKRNAQKTMDKLEALFATPAVVSVKNKR